MNLVLQNCIIRDLKLDDAKSLTRFANNRNVWINLRDSFPHPYTQRDANKFIKIVNEHKPATVFAIAIKDKAIGCIGYGIKTDVERVSAEIGYWIGEEFWDRGIVSDALKALTNYAIRKHNLTRIFALPFGWNDASFRVLEKAGYILEARLKNSAVKDGQIIDQLQYAYIVEK